MSSPAEDPATAPNGADAAPGAETLSYEQARAELVDVVRRLEDGSGTLEEALDLWERGEALAAACQRFLDGARARVAAVTGTGDAGAGEGGAGGPGANAGSGGGTGERPAAPATHTDPPS